jgi:tetratricopeptide (TPR) repeat protein
MEETSKAPLSDRRDWLYAALIVFAGLWIYWPVMTGDWLWDDNLYITENDTIRNPHGFWKALISTDGQRDYDPLTSAVRWLQWHFWGDAPLCYHATNLALHLTGAFLLWRLLSRVGVPAAWLGALVFTVHPLMVESVAWIAELKNTLSLPLLLLAMICWVNYDKGERPRDYLGTLAFFFLSLLAKSSGLMLPVILLGYTWWKYRKITSRDFRLCLPFFALTLAAGLVTMLSHPSASPEDSHHAGGLASRLASSGWALVFMLGKCLFPVGLMPAYPGRVVDAPSALDLVPWLVLVAGGYLAWRRRATWGMPVLLGGGFFLINLLPILGFIVKHYATMIWSLDHLLYLPIIGLIGLFAFGASLLQERLSVNLRPLGLAVITLAVGGMAFESRWYATAFSDSESLWAYAIDRAPHFQLAEQQMGLALLHDNRPEEAKSHFDEVLRLNPNEGSAHYNLGLIWDALGQFGKAIPEYQRAMQLEPDCSEMEDNLGAAQGQFNMLPEAIFHFQKAIELDPKNSTAYRNLGSALAQSGRYQEAVDAYSRALELTPDSTILYDNIGTALLKLGRVDEAKDHFQKALAIDPTDKIATESMAGLTGKNP